MILSLIMIHIFTLMYLCIFCFSAFIKSMIFILFFQKVRKARELNPHLKDDGAGLPEKEANVESLNLPSTSVGDGGYSWLKKAYYRIQEQSQREGRSMEEIAVERWGVRIFPVSF